MPIEGQVEVIGDPTLAHHLHEDKVMLHETDHTLQETTLHPESLRGPLSLIQPNTQMRRTTSSNCITTPSLPKRQT